MTDPSTLLRSFGGAVADPLGGAAIPGDIVSVLRRRAGGGAALPEQLAARIGTELGGDVSSARVHTDAEADRLARSVQAVAFTYGTDIYFSSGSFKPEDSAGQHLLAHELSHVVQAQGGTGDSAKGTIGAADDPAEHAAERSAARVVSALRRMAAVRTGAMRQSGPACRGRACRAGIGGVACRRGHRSAPDEPDQPVRPLTV